MRVRLTNSQVEMLRPYFDRVKAAAVLGSPGMLVAQLTHDQNGTYALTPAFLEHEFAKVITEKGREIPGETRRREVST